MQIELTGLGGRIKEERKRLGLSQSALGERVGAIAHTVGRYETGETLAPLDFLSAMAGLGANLTYLLSGSGRDTDGWYSSPNEKNFLATMAATEDAVKSTSVSLTAAQIAGLSLRLHAEFANSNLPFHWPTGVTKESMKTDPDVIRALSQWLLSAGAKLAEVATRKEQGKAE